MQRLVTAVASRLVIAVPYLWLLVFFLIPFAIVFKISLSQTAIAIPPYVPTLDLSDGISALLDGLKELSADNYTWLTEDALYFNAYLSSIIIAGISTILTLLVGYPIAYGMARAPTTLRPILLMLVILPFWTSFLIRVYAWIGILKPEGLLNQLLHGAACHRPAADHHEHPFGDLHRHRLFLSPLHGAAALFRIGEDGLFADRSGARPRLHAELRLLEDHVSAVACRASLPAACLSSSRRSASSSSPTCLAARRR